MRILYSCPLDPIKHAAPGHHVYSVVRELEARGHTLSLIHQGSTLQGIEKSQQYALNIKRYPFAGRLVCDIKYAFALFKVLRSNDFDFVYHRMEKWSVLPVMLFKLLKMPTVIEFNADNRAELVSVNASAITRYMYPFSEKIQARLASVIVVVSEGIGESLEKNIPSVKARIVVIENGADSQIFYPRDRDTACQTVNLDPAKKYITFSGSFQPWQGLDSLVSAAQLVINAVPDARFILIGDGRCRAALENTIRSNNLVSAFLLIGWIDPHDVAEFLAASNICVAPYSQLASLNPTEKNTDFRTSLMKCSPLKIYTYMAMGKPTVASGFLDGGERLVKWGTGLAFTPGSSTELAESLITLLEDETLADNLGTNAAIRAKRHHTWAAVAERIEQTCSERFAFS